MEKHLCENVCVWKCWSQCLSSYVKVQNSNKGSIFYVRSQLKGIFSSCLSNIFIVKYITSSNKCYKIVTFSISSTLLVYYLYITFGGEC